MKLVLDEVHVPHGGLQDTVTKQAAHGNDIGPFAELAAGERMAECMPACARNSGLDEAIGKPIRDGVGGLWFEGVKGIRKDPRGYH